MESVGRFSDSHNAVMPYTVAPTLPIFRPTVAAVFEDLTLVYP